MTPADFRNGFTFRKHQRFCISWSWAFVPNAVKRHEERWMFPAAPGLLHIFFPAAIYSASPQRSVLTRTSGLGRCTLSTHMHVTGPDPVWHLLPQQRLWLEVGLWCMLPPSPRQQSMETTVPMLITYLALANREGEVTNLFEFGATSWSPWKHFSKAWLHKDTAVESLH